MIYFWMTDPHLTKVSQSTIMCDSEIPHIGIKLNTLQSRKPPLSVQISNLAPQSSPVLSDSYVRQEHPHVRLLNLSSTLT